MEPFWWALVERLGRPASANRHPFYHFFAEAPNAPRLLSRLSAPGPPLRERHPA
jgi:hypothetical protein